MKMQLSQRFLTSLKLLLQRTLSDRYEKNVRKASIKDDVKVPASFPKTMSDKSQKSTKMESATLISLATPLIE